LDETANRLMNTHPESRDNTYMKQREINEEWTQLTVKANLRNEKLLDSYDLQRFLSDYRDLMSWINSMMGLVSSDELASDVTGAEALLERHQVKTKIKIVNFLDINVGFMLSNIHSIKALISYYILLYQQFIIIFSYHFCRV
jgi:hypothetical protein